MKTQDKSEVIETRAGLSWQAWMDLLSWDEMNAIAYQTGFRREDIGKLPCFDESKADIFNEAIDQARLAKLQPNP